MMVDALANLDLEIPELSPKTKDKLSFLPPICSRKNPIDVTADTSDAIYEKSLRVLAQSNEFDTLVALCIPPAFMKSEPMSNAVVKVGQTISIPIVACFMAGDLVTEGTRILEAGGVPNFPTVKRTAKAVWALAERGRYLTTGIRP